MYFYAQLNEENICIGMSQLSDVMDHPALIPIEAMQEELMYRKYENSTWSEQKYFPELPPYEVRLGVQESPEERIMVLEQIISDLNQQLSAKDFAAYPALEQADQLSLGELQAAREAIRNE